MGADTVTICNLALDSIGARSEISSLSEESQEARTLSLHYAPAVEAILQAAHWNFARKQATLAVLKAAAGSPENPDGTGPIPPAPWMYSYALPSDMVQARYVMPTYSTSATSYPGGSPFIGPEQPAVRFLIAADTDASGNDIVVILTNQPSAVLVYTYRVSNPNLFDGQFVIALANYIGSRIAIRLTGDKNMAKMAFQVADQTTKEARASNGNEGLTVNDVLPDWMSVRGYAADWAYPPGSVYWMSPQNLTFVS